MLVAWLTSKPYSAWSKRSIVYLCVMYRKTHTCPCHSMVLMRMMLSGRRSSEIRIWFSWSYTDFLGTFETNEKQRVWDRLTQASTFSPTSKEHVCGVIWHLWVVYLCYESWVWGALALHAAGPVALGLGVLSVFHGGAAWTPLQPVLNFTEERTKDEQLNMHDRQEPNQLYSNVSKTFHINSWGNTRSRLHNR